MLHLDEIVKPLFWMFAATITGLVLVESLTQVSRRDTIVLDAVTVPKLLIDRGYSPEVVAKRVRDRLDQIEHQVETTAPKNSVQLLSEVQLPEIDVPETKVSVKLVAQILQRLLNRTPAHVNAEITLDTEGLQTQADPANLEISVRVTGQEGVSLFREARIRTGDPHKAVDALAQTVLLEINPYLLALLYYDNEHKTKEALDVISDCINGSNVSQQSYAYNLWGLILLGQDDVDGAISKFSSAAEKGFALGHYNKGVALYERKNEPDKAIYELNQAQALSPDYPPAYTELGNVFVAQRLLDDAIVQYRKALNHYPDNPIPHNNWGYALALAGKMDDAIDQFKTAAGLDHKHKYAIIYCNWGHVLEEQNDIDGAVKNYEMAISENSDLFIAYDYLKKALDKKKLSLDPQKENKRRQLGSSKNWINESPLL
jgi:tetratricopeptide (TPR) repeat protein